MRIISRILKFFYGVFLLFKTKGRIICFNISNRTKVGNNTVIKRGSCLCDDVEVGSYSEILRNVILNKSVKVGDYTSINNNTIIECGSIGNFCSIGVDCIIGAGKHAINYITTSQLLYGDRYNGYDAPPIIGNDVWIGSRSIIMQGVNVADGSIIGAGAVVTKDVPPYAIVGGVPAHIIKYRFSPNMIDRLLNQRLWCNYKDNWNYIQDLVNAKSSFAIIIKDGE